MYVAGSKIHWDNLREGMDMSNMALEEDQYWQGKGGIRRKEK